jgi:hypothetical protein
MWLGCELRFAIQLLPVPAKNVKLRSNIPLRQACVRPKLERWWQCNLSTNPHLADNLWVAQKINIVTQFWIWLMRQKSRQNLGLLQKLDFHSRNAWWKSMSNFFNLRGEERESLQKRICVENFLGVNGVVPIVWNEPESWMVSHLSLFLRWLD